MLYLTITEEEFKSFLTAGLHDWGERCERLLERMLEASRRHGRATVAGVYEDEIICQLIYWRPDGRTHGCSLIKLQFLEEHLARKQQCHEDFTYTFWEEFYWGEDR